MSPKRQLVSAAVAVAGLWQLGRGIWDAWPVDQQALSLLRGTLAFIGAVAVAREAFAPLRLPASRPLVLGRSSSEKSPEAEAVCPMMTKRRTAAQ